MPPETVKLSTQPRTNGAPQLSRYSWSDDKLCSRSQQASSARRTPTRSIIPDPQIAFTHALTMDLIVLPGFLLDLGRHELGRSANFPRTNQTSGTGSVGWADCTISATHPSLHLCVVYIKAHLSVARGYIFYINMRGVEFQGLRHVLQSLPHPNSCTKTT